MVVMNNAERRTISVRVEQAYDGTMYPHDFHEGLEGRVTEILVYIAKAMKQYVPEEYRDTARFERDVKSYDYDGAEYSFTYLYYDRPETDEEMAARIGANQLREEAIMKNELAQLSALQKKYKVK